MLLAALLTSAALIFAIFGASNTPSVIVVAVLFGFSSGACKSLHFIRSSPCITTLIDDVFTTYGIPCVYPLRNPMPPYTSHPDILATHDFHSPRRHMDARWDTHYRVASRRPAGSHIDPPVSTHAYST